MYSARREPRFDPEKCGTIMCTECGEYFRTSGALDVHVKRIHRQLSRGECALCNLGFESGYFLKKHIIDTHGVVDNVPVRCSECGLQCLNLHKLRKHLKTHLPQTYVCRFCSYPFKKRQNMERHELLHLGKQFELTCPQCFKSCTQTANLIRHMKTHTKKTTNNTAKNVKCPFCAQFYEEYYYYQIHLKRHLEPPETTLAQSCSFCLKMFKSVREVDKHCTRVHGREDFLCTVCSGVFCDPRDGVKHIRINHPGSNALEQLQTENEHSVDNSDTVFIDIDKSGMDVGFRLSFQSTADAQNQDICLLTCSSCSQNVSLPEIVHHAKTHYNARELFMIEMGSDIHVVDAIAFDQELKNCIEWKQAVTICVDSVPGVEVIEMNSSDHELGVSDPAETTSGEISLGPENDNDKTVRNDDRLAPRKRKHSHQNDAGESELETKMNLDHDENWSKEPPSKKLKENNDTTSPSHKVGENAVTTSIHCSKTKKIELHVDGRNFVCEYCSAAVSAEDVATHFREHYGSSGYLRMSYERRSPDAVISNSEGIVVCDQKSSDTANEESADIAVVCEMESSRKVTSKFANENGYYEQVNGSIGFRDLETDTGTETAIYDMSEKEVWLMVTRFLQNRSKTFLVPTAANRAVCRKDEDIFARLDRMMNFPHSRKNDRNEGFRLNLLKMYLGTLETGTEKSLWCNWCKMIVQTEEMFEHLAKHYGDGELYLEENDFGFSAYDDNAKAADEVRYCEAELDRGEFIKQLGALVEDMRIVSEKTTRKECSRRQSEPLKQPKVSTTSNNQNVVPRARKTRNSKQVSVGNSFYNDQRRLRKREILECRKVLVASSLGEDGLSFTCHVCRQEFSEFSQLCEHVETQHKREKITYSLYCDKCGENFAREGDLKKHLLYGHKMTEDLGHCPLCYFIFTSYTGMGKHMTDHKKQMGFELKETPSASKLDEAVENFLQQGNNSATRSKIHVVEREFDIAIANSEELTEVVIDTNQDGVVDGGLGGVFVCAECNMTFGNLDEASDHINAQHDNSYSQEADIAVGIISGLENQSIELDTIEVNVVSENVQHESATLSNTGVVNHESVEEERVNDNDDDDENVEDSDHNDNLDNVDQGELAGTSRTRGRSEERANKSDRTPDPGSNSCPTVTMYNGDNGNKLESRASVSKCYDNNVSESKEDKEPTRVTESFQVTGDREQVKKLMKHIEKLCQNKLKSLELVKT